MTGLQETPGQHYIVEIPHPPYLLHGILLIISSEQPQEVKEEVGADVTYSGGGGGRCEDIRHIFQSGCSSCNLLRVRDVGSDPPPTPNNGVLPLQGCLVADDKSYLAAARQ